MESNILTTKEITKTDIQTISSDVISQLEAGTLNPFFLQKNYKALEKIMENVKSKLVDCLNREIDKYPEKKTGVEMFGATFKQGEFGTKYSYAETGDPVWQELNAKTKELQEKLKERETFLKGIKGSETIVDTNSGEIVTVYEPAKTSTTSVSCSINK